MLNLDPLHVRPLWPVEMNAGRIRGQIGHWGPIDLAALVLEMDYGSHLAVGRPPLGGLSCGSYRRLTPFTVVFYVRA
jgi:hypothetical protein